MINDRVFISESILVILRSIRLKVVVRSKIEFFIELCISMFVEILNNFVVHPLPALSGHSGQRSGSGRKRIFALQSLAERTPKNFAGQHQILFVGILIILDPLVSKSD